MNGLGEESVSENFRIRPLPLTLKKNEKVSKYKGVNKCKLVSSSDNLSANYVLLNSAKKWLFRKNP